MFNNMKKVFVCLLLLLSSGIVYGQVKPYVQFGVGTGLKTDFFKSEGLDFEGGVKFKGLQVGVSFTWLNSLTLKEMTQGVFLETGKKENISGTVDRNISGIRSSSIMLNIGYDLLRLIPGNSKHHLLPYVGAGWSGCTLLDVVNSRPIPSVPNTYETSVVYKYKSGVDFSLGAKYEYSITDKWNLGISYKYFDSSRRDMLSICTSYSF